MSDWHSSAEPAPLGGRMGRTLRRIVAWAFAAFAGASVAFLGTALFYSLLSMRYDLGVVASLPAATTFLDRDGKEIPGSQRSGRLLVERAEIPVFLLKALQAREDARFFDHSGVDIRGLSRAVLRNIRDRGMTQGGSTITMQLARNTFRMRGKTLHRKLLEIALTLQVEERYSKDEILTHYLNRIYFGAGAHGVEQAARTYFGKTTRALTEGECALLVGIIRGPHLFSPFRNLPAALEQRDQTLARMAAMGFITDEQRQKFAGRKIRLVPEDQRQAAHAYALQAARRELDGLVGLLDLRVDGLRVGTTLDLNWQRKLEAETARAAARIEKLPRWPHPTPAQHEAGGPTAYLQIAAITTDLRTGGIRALVGGRDFSHSRYERTRSRRDLGPVFLPFVAAAAAERGKPVFENSPVSTGRGVGPEAVERIARRCGLAGSFSSDEDLFRGAASAAPVELAAALGVIAGDGRHARPFLIREIHDDTGKLVYEAKPRLRPALRPESAAAALRSFRRSGRTRTLSAVTRSTRDAWLLRAGPTGATVIWFGLDQPASLAASDALLSKLEELAARLGGD